MVRDLYYDLLPKQQAFMESTKRELLYSGAFGAGKSRALCMKAVVRASVPGAREGMCRKWLQSFTSSTLKVLLESDGDLPPVLPSGTYSHNKKDRIIRINGGGEIQYFGLDDPDKIGSYNLTGCAPDEAVDLTKKDWRMLRGRIRVKVKGLKNQIYGACNPGPPSHFLAERFGLAKGFECAPNCEAIMTCSKDNFFLPQDYIDDLNTFVGIAKARYVDGLWVGSDGLVYDQWDRTKFVMERTLDDAGQPIRWNRVIVGQDEGYTNPAVMLVICEDYDGRLHIVHEWYHAKKRETEVVAAAKDIQRRFKVDLFVIDPSAKKLIEAMRHEGLAVREANNSVFDGIQTVQKRLMVAGDGRPRLTVDPSCVNTIREKETYEWKQNTKGSSDFKDEPVKANDHAMDAERYGVMFIDGSSFKIEQPSRIENPIGLSAGFSTMMGSDRMYGGSPYG